MTQQQSLVANSTAKDLKAFQNPPNCRVADQSATNRHSATMGFVACLMAILISQAPEEVVVIQSQVEQQHQEIAVT